MRPLLVFREYNYYFSIVNVIPFLEFQEKPDCQLS